MRRYLHGELVCTFKGCIRTNKSYPTGSYLVHAELTSAACRADLFSARVLIKVGVTNSLFCGLGAMYMASVYKSRFRTNKSYPWKTT